MLLSIVTEVSLSRQQFAAIPAGTVQLPQDSAIPQDALAPVNENFSAANLPWQKCTSNDNCIPASIKIKAPVMAKIFFILGLKTRLQH